MTLDSQEQARLVVLGRVDRRELTAVAAAELLGVSERQVRRLLAGYRHEGAAAVAHGNRGRPSTRALDSAVRARVVALARTTYAHCNHQHLSELLAEREGITVSRSSLRRMLLAAGVSTPRKRRGPKHRSRRDRMAQEGMLLQIDGSRHAWLGDQRPMLTLIAAIDDAIGTVPYALFREQEDAHGYFLLLETIVTRPGYGRPLAIYRDRHGIFERSTKEPETLAEQLAGRREPTQFGRLLEELDITAIPARSPQAKGRIERLWGTFQDRLVAELLLAGAETIDDANALLPSFLKRFNARFYVFPQLAGTAYRPLAPGMVAAELFCFKYLATVANDNTVPFAGQQLQLLPGPGGRSYAKATVEVHERLDGSLAVFYQGRCLTATAAPPTAPALRARRNPRPRLPAPIHFRRQTIPALRPPRR